MAAGLGFKDFTTGEVLTAADVDGYLMQGIWVFASAAARDAAVTSPQEGNFAFLKDTNTTTYYTGSAWTNLDTTGMVNPMTTTGDTIYSSSGSTPARLGIGSTGQVLTVAGGIPSWATPSGGGGMTLLSTTTLSGASTTIGSISQDYTNLYILSKGITLSTSTLFRFNDTSLGGTGTDSMWLQWDVNNAISNSGNANDQVPMTAFDNSLSTNANNVGNFIIYDYASSSTNKNCAYSTSHVQSANSRYFTVNGMAVIRQTSAISSLTFVTGSGTFSGGTIQIYGVK